MQKSNLLTYSVVRHRTTAKPLFESFYYPTSARHARRFPWHVLLKQRSCPLIPGFSSIRAWATQPLLGLLDYRQVQTATESTLDIHPLYKGTRLLFSLPCSIESFPHLELKHPKFRSGAPNLQSCPDLAFKADGCLPPSRKKTSKS